MEVSSMGIPMVLAFNLEESALQTLQRLCTDLEIRCKSVPPEGFSLPIGTMVGIPVMVATSRAGENFTEPMLIMCNLNEVQFNAFLQGLRYSSIPRIDLKAVLTPTNVAWNAIQLHEELSRERDAVRRAERKK